MFCTEVGVSIVSEEKARTSAHPASAGIKLEDKRPTIAMNYFYLGKKEDDSLPILGVLEETSQRCFS